MVADTEVDTMADIVADMEVNMVADIEVDMVADMEVDMVADMEVDMMDDMVATKVVMSRTFLRPNVFEPKLTPACASFKLCEFIFAHIPEIFCRFCNIYIVQYHAI